MANAQIRFDFVSTTWQAVVALAHDVEKWSDPGFGEQPDRRPSTSGCDSPEINWVVPSFLQSAFRKRILETDAVPATSPLVASGQASSEPTPETEVLRGEIAALHALNLSRPTSQRLAAWLRSLVVEDRFRPLAEFYPDLKAELRRSEQQQLSAEILENHIVTLHRLYWEGQFWPDRPRNMVLGRAASRTSPSGFWSSEVWATLELAFRLGFARIAGDQTQQDPKLVLQALDDDIRQLVDLFPERRDLLTFTVERLFLQGDYRIILGEVKPELHEPLLQRLTDEVIAARRSNHNPDWRSAIRLLARFRRGAYSRDVDSETMIKGDVMHGGSDDPLRDVQRIMENSGSHFSDATDYPAT